MTYFETVRTTRDEDGEEIQGYDYSKVVDFTWEKSGRSYQKVKLDLPEGFAVAVPLPLPENQEIETMNIFSYTLRNRNGGFLFITREEYTEWKDSPQKCCKNHPTLLDRVAQQV